MIYSLLYYFIRSKEYGNYQCNCVVYRGASCIDCYRIIDLNVDAFILSISHTTWGHNPHSELLDNGSSFCWRYGDNEVNYRRQNLSNCPQNG